MLKAIFVLEIFIFLPRLFGYVEKRLDQITIATFEGIDFTDWTINYYNTPIAKYLKK